MCIRSMCGSRESSENDWRRVSLSVRLEKAEGRNASVYASEQSDRPIVPEKPPNKGSSTRDILATDLRG